MIFLLLRWVILILLFFNNFNNFNNNQLDLGILDTSNITPYFEFMDQSVAASSYSVRIQGVKDLDNNTTNIIEDDGFLYEQVLSDVKPSEKFKINQNIEKEPLFYWKMIDQEIADRIVGSSWKEGAPVELSDLAYLQITYWGYDDQEHIGEMIVHISVAKEVLEIFKELYENKYYIEKMVLIDEYDANDDKSMADNNTSSFCYRNMAGSSNNISKHSYGIAIDINPLVNPYVKGDLVLPREGAKYINREVEGKGIIKKGDPCYEAFIKRGWQWGGDWDTPKDYQHFEKNLIQYTK